MKVERNFNKRTAPLVEIRKPLIDHGKGDALGVQVVMIPADQDGTTSSVEIGVLRMHMTPQEALDHAENLITHAQALLAEQGAGDSSGQPAADLIRRMRNRLNVLASEDADMADQADAAALVAEADALLADQPVASAEADREKLMRAIVEAGQRAGIIRADLETASVTECLHILECLSQPAASAEPVGPVHLRDGGSEIYLDGVQCRYSIERGEPWPYSDTLAYVFDPGIAERIVAALNAAPVAQEPVAYRVMRKSLDGEWKSDGRDWCDGRPSADLVADIAKRSDGWRIEYAYATAPVAALADTRSDIQNLEASRDGYRDDARALHDALTRMVAMYEAEFDHEDTYLWRPDWLKSALARRNALDGNHDNQD